MCVGLWGYRESVLKRERGGECVCKRVLGIERMSVCVG